MASQPRIIAGGLTTAALITVARFIVAPVITTTASLIEGLKGTLLLINIMQATLPLAIVPFIYAQEYNVHPGILSTAYVSLPFKLKGLLVALWAIAIP
ncbi:putative auxin efflux carrier component 1b [Bienertia sinuspersici]